MAWGDGLPRDECAGRRGRGSPYEHAKQAEQRYRQATERIPGSHGTRESRHLKVIQVQERRLGEQAGIPLVQWSFVCHHEPSSV